MTTPNTKSETPPKCPKCHRPVNLGNSPNCFECHETDDDEGICEAYEKIFNLQTELTQAQKELKDWIFNAKELQKQVNNSEPERAKLIAERNSLAKQLEEAHNEIHCCDDVILKVPLAKSIADLCQQRDALANQLEEALAHQEVSFHTCSGKDCKNKYCQLRQQRDSLAKQNEQLRKALHDIAYVTKYRVTFQSAQGRAIQALSRCQFLAEAEKQLKKA